MTLGKAHERIAEHIEPGNVYNRNAGCMVPGEVMRDHGQPAVEQLIRDHGLEQKRGIKPGTHFESAFK